MVGCMLYIFSKTKPYGKSVCTATPDAAIVIRFFMDKNLGTSNFLKFHDVLYVNVKVVRIQRRCFKLSNHLKFF
jgi:hypothetical protein